MIIMEPEEYVKQTLDERELLEQLAEEAAELSQAALKLIRAKKLTNNPTPVSEEYAIANLLEEYNDVIGVGLLLGLHRDEGAGAFKYKRWAGRIYKHMNEKGES